MTPEQLAHFRKRLQDDYADISAQLADLQQRLEGSEENSDQPDDFGDEAQTAVQQEEVQIEIDVLKSTLRQIENALDRIADGAYGVSEVSGKPIPIERLEALPYATRLVDE